MCSPTPPSPQAQIQQQTSSNKETAVAQAGLNMVNQTDAAGNSLTFNQIGTWADGTPRYASTQSLSDAGKALLTTGQQTEQNLANLAKEQSGRLSGLLNDNIDFSAQKDYLEGLTSGALDKSWNRQAQDFETSLINRGIRPGTEAYKQQMNDFAVNRSDAYNSANVNNYDRALQSQLALRAQPLNEILALSGGSQVQTPTFGQITSPTSIAGTDVAGITQNNFANQNTQYGNQQSVLGGLFKAGANLLSFSDRRAKRDITRIGTLPNGLPWYTFNYIWDSEDEPLREGLMSDDVRQLIPSAVMVDDVSGYDQVNYPVAMGAV